MTSPAPKQLNPDILALLFTREDVDLLQTEAEKAKRRLFLVAPRPPKGPLFGDVSQKNEIIFRKVLSLLGADPTPGKMREALTLLQNELRSLPVVKITLAFPPPQELVEEVVRWARENFRADAVLEVEVDPALLGGAVVSFGGKYFDRSLRRRLQEQWPALEKQLAKELAAAGKA